MGLPQMAYILPLAYVSLLAIFARAQDLQDCNVVASPFTVGSTEDASTLATSLGCSTGAFDVRWVGGVFVAETIHVTDGTSLSITSAGSSAAIADGRNATQLFVVDRGSSLHLSDMTIAHGNASFGGAINAFEASVSFGGNVRFISNSAGVDGGAIFANRSTIFWDGDGTQFVFNVAGDDGGAIYADHSTVSWDGDGTFFHSNSAGGDDGGAIYMSHSNVSWDGNNTQFISNSAGEDGGAIYAYSGSIVFWYGDGTQFISNVGNSTNYGGAIFAYESTVFWDGDGTQFLSNGVGYGGGAIYAEYSTVSWIGDDTMFRNNTGGEGGAIRADNSAVLWDGNNTEFSSNAARINGGAIKALSSILTWHDDGAQFRSNSALSGGGAVYARTSTLSLDGDDIQFVSNSAGSHGGAIDVYSSMLSWNGDGANFSSNAAGSYGGAISWGSSSIVYWNGDGTQFTSNSAGSSGGAIYVYSTVLTWNGDGALFSFNVANESGGAIVAGSDVLWNGEGAVFSSNSADVEGGAIHLGGNQGNMSLNGGSIQFSSNTAGEYGGAISGLSGGLWSGNGTQFISNSAGVNGGAMYLSSTSVSLHCAQFSSNSAGGEGGAIFVTGGAIVLSDGNTTFSRNMAGENGGAISSVENDELAFIFNGGTFIENSAGNGGAFYLRFAIGFNLTNVIFQSNSASDSGGAVAAYSTGTGDPPTATFTRCNFSDNMSETGGGVETLAGQLEFYSCIFEGNSAGIGGAMRIGGTTVCRECSFLSNSASIRGFAVSVEGSATTSIATSSFDGNAIYCGADSYRKDTEEEGPAARYETVCVDCPEWDECSGCSIATGNLVSTCEAPLEHTEAAQPGTTLETLNIAGGYWRATSDSDNILACYNANACNGGQTGTEDYCAPGYTGPYCAVCEAGYSPSLSYSCTRCSSSRRQGLMAAIVIASFVVACVGVAIVRYLVSTPQLEERNVGCFHRRILRAIPLQALKIIVVVWQILIQFADAAQVMYPGVYQDFLSAIDVVNFDLGSVLSAVCLWSNMDFHDRLLVNTLGPLVVVGLLGITYRVAMCRSRAAGGDAVVEKIRYRHQTVLLLVTFLIYSSVSSTVFQTFACETLDDGAKYLRADYNIQCTDAKHKNFEVYAAIMIFVYPVGVPLLYAILLFQRRDVLADADADKTIAQSISGLWEPYRPERFYYEVIECGRRIMLTGVVVFIFPNDAAQIAITMLLAFFFLAIFEILRPYEADSDMWLSRGGHVVVFLSMFYFLLLKVDVSGERSESQVTYGGLLLAAHVLMMLAIVVEVVGICYASRGNEQVVEDKPSSSGSLPKSAARAGSDEARYS